MAWSIIVYGDKDAPDIGELESGVCFWFSQIQRHLEETLHAYGLQSIIFQGSEIKSLFSGTTGDVSVADARGPDEAAHTEDNPPSEAPLVR